LENARALEDDSDEDENEQHSDSEMVDESFVGAPGSGLPLGQTNGAVATGSAAARKRRSKLAPLFPMYPYIELRRPCDEYGEAIDYAQLTLQLDSTPLAPTQPASLPMDIDDQSKAQEPPETPSKVVSVLVTRTVRCQVAYVDLEGRADSPAFRTMLPKLAPRKLILVHGSTDARSSLRDFMQKHCMVWLPEVNQLVDVTSETNIYRLNLKDSLLAGARFVQVDDGCEVAYVDGEVRIDYAKSTLPMLEAAPVLGHPAVFLGDVKLADVQRTLDNIGVEASFFGGILICAGGLVNIRKVSPSQISIRGALCEEYFRIRSALYSKYSII